MRLYSPEGLEAFLAALGPPGPGPRMERKQRLLEATRSLYARGGSVPRWLFSLAMRVEQHEL